MATHFPSLSRADNIATNVHMFIEDIQLDIMPIGGRSRQKNFLVEFKGKKTECDKATEIIRELGKIKAYDNREIVCDAVNNIVRNLVWDGQAYYEIIKDKKQVYIKSFTSKNLYKLFGYYLQIIPKADRTIWNRKFSFANQSIVWEIVIPKSLGGVKKYQKLLKQMSRYDNLGPDFYRENLNSGLIEKDFDFMKYRRNNKIYIDSATKNWGWNGRNWTQDRCTEFYTFYRMLNFKYAQSLLREHVIDQINCLFKRLSIKCKLKIKGLPTSKKILKIRKKMEIGELSFNDVSEKVQI